MSAGVRVLHVFSTFAAGGPQVRTARLLPELERSWKHAIVALDGCTDARELLAPELRVEFLPAPPRAGTPRTALALARLFCERRPDLLLTYNFGAVDALLASRFARPRAVLHHEDGFRPDEVAGFKRRRIWMRRALLPRTDGVIVPSFTLEAIATRLWKLPPALLHRIPNGIRVEDFPPADRNPARRAALGIPLAAPLIGCVGHLRAEKNPVRALAALARPELADARLLMLGDGPERAHVERAARELGVAARVHLVGHRSDPRDDYRAMDVFLMTSDTEQMPVALLEAMASALPVVSTDVGDVRSILPEEQGTLLTPPGPAAAAALAAALAGLCADAKTRADLGRRNRERVERDFSFDAMVRAYRACYGRALAR